MSETTQNSSEKSSTKKPLLRRAIGLVSALSGAETMREIARPWSRILSNGLEQSHKLQQSLWERTLEVVHESQEIQRTHLQSLLSMSKRSQEIIRQHIKEMGDPGRS